MTNELVFEADELTKTYGGRVALAGVSFEVRRGEILSLLGPNGAGKTTTVSVFLGFVRPDGGRARVCGLDVGPADAAIRARLAYVPEQVSLYPHFSGLENLRYFLALSSAERPDDGRLLDALAETGLPREAAARPVGTYSKGMRQRVAIALALAKAADGLLLDEPTSGLDPAAAAELSDLLRRVRDRGAAILMVTHDLPRAHDVATRLGILCRGRLVDLADPRDVSAADLQRRYLTAVDAR
jgi:ABC-2 type transport system ATP-binding protein